MTVSVDRQTIIRASRLSRRQPRVEPGPSGGINTPSWEELTVCFLNFKKEEVDLSSFLHFNLSALAGNIHSELQSGSSKTYRCRHGSSVHFVAVHIVFPESYSHQWKNQTHRHLGYNWDFAGLAFHVALSASLSLPWQAPLTRHFLVDDLLINFYSHQSADSPCIHSTICYGNPTQIVRILLDPFPTVWHAICTGAIGLGCSERGLESKRFWPV